MVSAPGELEELARALEGAASLSFDLESDGMFAYRARICAVQLASPDAVTVVDTLATPLAPLAALLGESGPVKLVHDVPFDARMLAEAGI
jgi:ribonuclease D